MHLNQAPVRNVKPVKPACSADTRELRGCFRVSMRTRDPVCQQQEVFPRAVLGFPSGAALSGFWRRDMSPTCYLITRTCVCVLRHVVQYRCSSACWEAADSNTKGNSDSRWQLYKIKASAEELNEHFFLLDYKWKKFMKCFQTWFFLSLHLKTDPAQAEMGF